MLNEARNVCISIAAPWQRVYAYAADPRNLPRWAAGLAGSIAEEGGAWVAESPMGRVRVQMAPRNVYGVLDHDVTLPDGQVFHNPMRVVPNGDGSELAFTLYRGAGVDAAAFERDAAAVARDLQTLKALLEGGALEGAGAAPAPNDRCIDYVELVVADIARAKAFWSAAFGWTYRDYGPAYCEFSDGRLTGGFTTQGEVRSGGGPLVVLYADDLAGAQARVEAAGGAVVVPVFDFPGGRRFQFADLDGYEFAVWSRA